MENVKGPFLRDKNNTKKIMLNLVLALLPICIFAIYKNGIIPYIKGKDDILEVFRILIFLIVGPVTTYVTEYVYYKLFMKDKKDYLNLEELYNKLGFLMIEKKEVKTDIYSVIESEFGRTLSPMEYEIVRAWIDNGFNEELIKEALKEAIYNHVTSLRYIDTILYEWNKKGYKVPSDIKKEVKKTNNKKELLDYDWLNEDE